MKTKLKHKHVKENNKIKNNNNNRTALPKISGSQRKFHSVEIALNKKINGNGKVYKIYEIPFSHRKKHPVFTNLSNFFACCPSPKSEQVPLLARKFAPLQEASLLHIWAQANKESAFSLWRAFSSTRQAFSSMRKNMPRSSSADILGVTKKAHMRANMSQGKICKKGN